MNEVKIDIADADKISKTVDSILKEFGINVSNEIQEAVDEVGKEAVKKLKASSPKNTGPYARGWKYKKMASKNGNHESLVYNSSGWLTHLLEHGHPIVRNGVVCGRAKAYPHIEPVESWVQSEFPKRVSEKLKTIK